MILAPWLAGVPAGRRPGPRPSHFTLVFPCVGGLGFEERPQRNTCLGGENLSIDLNGPLVADTPREWGYHKRMLYPLIPHLCVRSVLELDAARLDALGLNALLLDVDCTLKEYVADDVSPEVAAWLGQLRASGVGLCLVSNGRGQRISRLAERLRLPFVSTAMKPLPRGCLAAIRRLDFDRARTAMVGDQLFADVMAGRLAGLFTILVDPIHPEQEPWFTRLKRPFEAMVLRRNRVKTE